MSVGVYYNEINPYCAQWLRNLINAGEIAAGEVSRTLPPANCQVLISVTSLQVSEYGLWLYAMPDGTIHDQHGQVVARVNLSARQVKALGLMTSGTYGHIGSTSLAQGFIESVM